MNPMLKRRAPGSSAHCHIQVAKVAQGMAHEAYDALMERNGWYKLWQSQWPDLAGEALENKWVALHWGRFLESARATLGQMLTRPIDEALKSQIYEALILDAQLIRGRKNGAIGNA